jgi:hypothetical protein
MGAQSAQNQSWDGGPERVGRRRTAEQAVTERDDAATFDEPSILSDGATPVAAAELAPRWTRPAAHRRSRDPRQLRMLTRENDELRARVSRLERENAQLKRMVANEQLRILALRSLAKGHW